MTDPSFGPAAECIPAPTLPTNGCPSTRDSAVGNAEFSKNISLIIRHLQRFSKKSFRQMANFHFSTPYYIEGCVVPLRGARPGAPAQT